MTSALDYAYIIFPFVGSAGFPQRTVLTKVAPLIPTKAVFDTWVARVRRPARHPGRSPRCA
jgi:hypothetical protein